MTQLEFSDIQHPAIFGDISPRVVDAFISYHRENPQVYEGFVRYAKALKQAGREHYGAKGIMEKLRFETAIQGGDDFKINNSYSSCYARLMAWEFSEFRDFFEFRHSSKVAA